MTRGTSVRRDGVDRSLPDVGRLITFLDAAVAIALTLLVLPLVDRVPEAVRAHERPAELLLGNLAPLGSFALSFWVIWRFWTVHHRVFAQVRQVGPLLLQLNLLWLFAVVLLPFVTEMVASYGDPLVAQLYIGLLLVCSATLSAMVVVLRRTAAPDDRPRDRFFVGALTATAETALALVLVVPGLRYWPLLLLLADPVIEPVVAAVHRRLVGGHDDGATG